MRQGCSRRSLKQTAVTSCCTAVLKSRVLEERRPRHSCEKVWHMVTCRAGVSTCHVIWTQPRTS